MLSRYGHADQEATLDKLGGVGWQSRKAKVKERIRELAGELIKVAAERAMRKGTVLDLPHGVYEEFAARFPYEETEDQLAAIEAVLEDMGSGRPMDRLLCGDVGFGKTEVALRRLRRRHVRQAGGAASPRPRCWSGSTTGCSPSASRACRSAWRRCRASCRPRRRARSRRTWPPARSTSSSARTLLGKGVEFKNLGLVIVDEEQHFGVTHKEKLKQLRAEVHVLTMTATRSRARCTWRWAG